MKSPAKLKLSKIETEIFQERLKYMTPRQVDLNFEELIEKFKEHKKIYDEKLAIEKKEEEKRYVKPLSGSRSLHGQATVCTMGYDKGQIHAKPSEES